MKDYRAMIAPYLESIRRPSTTSETIRRYTDRLGASIDFLEQGGFKEPSEEYYTALEKHNLSLGLAPSTTSGRVKLARRFFEWMQKGQINLPIYTERETEAEAHAVSREDEQASCRASYDAYGESRALKPEGEEAEDDTPPLSVEEEIPSHAPCKDDMPPQEEKGGESKGKKQKTGRPRKSPEKRDVKMSIYLTKELKASLEDLAHIQRVTVPDYIFRLIERESERRADALAAFRALEEY